MKSVWMSIFACVVILLAGLAFAPSAQAQTGNRPPCDFTDQFYSDSGLLSCAPQPDGTCTRVSGAELDTEPDGRFGDSGLNADGQQVNFRQFGPPATQPNQANYVADATCSANDPTRRNFRILATTGANSDDGNSPFSTGTNETLEFISILAFVHNLSAMIGAINNPLCNPNTTTCYSRTVGAIGPNGGLDNQQTNAGTTISMVSGADADGQIGGLNPRSISLRYILSNFPGFAAVKQTLADGTFALNPCDSTMASPLAPATPCFSVFDSLDANGNTISDVATPNLRQDWRFATNRMAIDGSDMNCINTQDQICKSNPLKLRDSPFGYFCDDLLGMWIVDYFWFVQPPNTSDPVCGPLFSAIGAKNGFSLDGTPIVLTESELTTLEGDNCAADAKETPGDGGAVWLVCPAIPDPTNGAIASDAFLDAVQLPSGQFQDSFLSQNFTCLQQTGQFCTQ